LRYIVFYDNHCHQDIGVYIASGIMFERSNFQHCIHDISVNAQTVKQLANLLNKFEVEPEHCRDVVEDFLSK